MLDIKYTLDRGVHELQLDTKLNHVLKKIWWKLLPNFEVILEP